MLLTSSGSSLDPLLAWSMGSSGIGRFHIKFPLKLDWYHEQPCTQFRSLRHHKERTGLQHEFIVLQLEDGSICRIERMGDPNARLEAITVEGTVAYDIAQSFTSDRLSEACLGTSDVVAIITFPRLLDIMDVLRICRAIHEGEKTSNYTLQSFNCYFLALAIQAVLTALVRGWETNLSGWCAGVEKGIEFLIESYNSPPHDREKLPFFPRIYSLLEPETRWPAEDLVIHLGKKLDDPEVVAEASKAFSVALWHSHLELAIEYVLCRRVRDITMHVLLDPKRIHQHPTWEQCIASSPNLDSDSNRVQCRNLLVTLASQAASRHEAEFQTPKLGQMQRHIGLFRAFRPSSTTRRARHRDQRILNFVRKTKPQPPTVYTPQPTVLRLPNPQALIMWITYARMLVFWAVQIMSGLFYSITPMYARRLRKYVVVEDELESALVGSNKSDDNSDVFDVGLMTQKLRSLLGISDSLMWNEWPWAHVYHPIKSHVLSSVIEGEDKSIEVAFSNESSSQAMSVSAFQDHLLERIKLHSRRVESFGLGQAAHIREELEEKLSQVWALVRNDDDKDWAPAEPVVTFNPVVAPPETAFEYGSDDGGWIYGGNLENDDSTDLASEDGAMPYWGGKVKKKNGGTKKKSNNKTKKKRGRGIKRHEELKRSEGIAKRKPILIVGDESP